MSALFKKLADGAQIVVDAAQKASLATGHALSELNALLMAYSKFGVFQGSAKKELKVAIDAKMKSLQEIKLKLDGVEKKLNELNNIFPDAEMKKKEIAEYDESLSRIESMFENR